MKIHVVFSMGTSYAGPVLDGGWACPSGPYTGTIMDTVNNWQDGRGAHAKYITHTQVSRGCIFIICSVSLPGQEVQIDSVYGLYGQEMTLFYIFFTKGFFWDQLRPRKLYQSPIVRNHKVVSQRIPF